MQRVARVRQRQLSYLLHDMPLTEINIWAFHTVLTLKRHFSTSKLLRQLGLLLTRGYQRLCDGEV